VTLVRLRLKWRGRTGRRSGLGEGMAAGQAKEMVAVTDVARSSA